MPEVVGSAVYGLDLDRGTFSTGVAQSEQQLSRLKTAGDAVTRSNAGVSQSLGGIGRTAAAVALGMGGLSLAVTAAKDAISGTIAQAAEDAASQARLRAAVAATGAEYSKYADTIEEVIKKGQERGFSDDQTRSGLSILVAQTDSVAEATKRYAIAQDLARGANIDVVTASRLLGKITDENVTALQRYGISIKQGSTETEALAAVQRKFAGQADAFANSTAGGFARADDAIREAGESIGRVLLPGVAAGADEVAHLAQDVEGFTNKLDAVGIKGGAVFPELVRGAVAFGAVIASFKIAEFAAGLERAAVARARLTRVETSFPFATTPTTGITRTVQGEASLGTFAKSFATPQVGIIAATLAVVGLDSAVRHFTGSGIVGFLRGEASAAREAATAHDAQAAAIDKIKTLESQGVSPGTAQSATIITAINDFEEARKSFLVTVAAERESLSKIESLRPPTPQPTANVTPQPGATPTPSLSPAVARATGDLDAYNTALRVFANTLIGTNPNLQQTIDLLKQFPELRGSPEFVKFLETTNKLLGDAAIAAVSWEQAIKTAKDAQSAFANAAGDLQSLSGAADLFAPQIDALKEEKLQLEQLKTTMGDAFGAGNEDHLESVTRRLDALTKSQEQVTAAIAQFETQVQQTYGALAPQAIQNVASLLADPRLSADQKIQISVILPDLFKIQSAFAAFIKALREGATVDIAVRIAATTAAPAPSTKPKTIFDQPFPGETPLSFQSRQPVGDEAQKIIDQLHGKIDDLSNNALAPLGNIADKTGAAVDKALSQADQDLIALNAAFQQFHDLTGGTIEDFLVLLKVGQDKIDLDKRQADVAIQLRANALEAADGLYQARLGLVQVAEAAAQAGITVPQETARIFTSIKEQAQSLVDNILNQPTREGTELKLKLDKLELQKLELEREGAKANVAKKDGKDVRTSADKALDRVDAQITSLQREIEIRQKNIDIMRDEAILADQGLATDRTLINAYVFLVAIIRNVSTSLNNLVGPLDALAAGHAASGGFHSGLTIVGEKGPELVNLGNGSMVFPADVTRQILERAAMPRLNPGISLPQFAVPNFVPQVSHNESHVAESSTVINIYGATDPDAVAKRVQKALDDRDRVRNFAGATSSLHSYTPRG